MIPCFMLWYRVHLYVCLYCVILIIIILVRFMQPPCMLNVVQFTACLLANLACVCLAKLWSTKRPRKFGSRAWFKIYWQNVVWSRTVRLCRYFASTRCGTFLQVYRGTERCCSTSDDISGRTVSSDRIVSSHLISVAERGHASEQFIALLVIVRRRSQIFVDPRRKIVFRR